MDFKIKPCSRKKDILMQEIIGEIMIYDLKINKAYLLNSTSSMIWQLCDGTKSVTEIAGLVSKELDSSVPEDLVWLALDQFKKDNLLDDKDLKKINFLAMSRREIVRKIGLSSMVALPLISSIVVPNSVEGASCIPDNGLCAVPADCCNNCCADLSDGASICIPLQAGNCPACANC